MDEWIKKIHEIEYQSALKEGNPAICDSMGGPGGHYAKWTQKASTARSHLYMESKIVKHIEESRMVLARVCGEGEMGRCWSNGTKFPLCKISLRDVLFRKKTKNVFHCSHHCSPLLHFSTILIASKDGPLVCFGSITHPTGLNNSWKVCQNIKLCMCVWTFNIYLLHCCLYQGSAHFLYKGPASNTLSFADHKLCCNYSTLPL